MNLHRQKSRACASNWEEYIFHHELDQFNNEIRTALRCSYKFLLTDFRTICAYNFVDNQIQPSMMIYVNIQCIFCSLWESIWFSTLKILCLKSGIKLNSVVTNILYKFELVVYNNDLNGKFVICLQRNSYWIRFGEEWGNSMANFDMVLSFAVVPHFIEGEECNQLSTHYYNS